MRKLVLIGIVAMLAALVPATPAAADTCSATAQTLTTGSNGVYGFGTYQCAHNHPTLDIVVTLSRKLPGGTFSIVGSNSALVHNLSGIGVSTNTFPSSGYCWKTKTSGDWRDSSGAIHDVRLQTTPTICFV